LICLIKYIHKLFNFHLEFFKLQKYIKKACIENVLLRSKTSDLWQSASQVSSIKNYVGMTFSLIKMFINLKKHHMFFLKKQIIRAHILKKVAICKN
jgi:hypothetical protein